MDTVLYLIVTATRAILSIAMLGMLARSLISLFFFGEDNKFIEFVFFITDPFIVPVRALLEKLNILQGTPIDFSFMITVLLLGIVSAFL